MVIEVFRHGARSPIITDYPVSFGANWELGPGELTPIGERQQYLSGLKRREKYIYSEEFLPDFYTPGTFDQLIYAESSPYNRTQMSAYAHLWGIYPFKKRENVDIQIEDKIITVHNSIPVHMRGDEHGVLNGYSTEYCHTFKILEEKSIIESNIEFSQRESISKMINELNEKFNLTGNQKYVNFSDIADAVDSYYSVINNARPHTIHMSDFFIEKMDLYLWLRMHFTFLRDDFGVKIASHSFFSIINSLISHKMGVENPTPEDYNTKSIPKNVLYYIFSGHDTSLAAILAGLGHK